MDQLANVLECDRAGLSVFALPFGQKKWPKEWGRWRHWRERRPTRAELATMFGNGPANTALAFGRASGYAFGLDCDTRQAYAEGGYEPQVSVFTDRVEEDFTGAVIRHLRRMARR